MSPSTVELIRVRMQRLGQRKQCSVVKAFYETPTGAIVLAYDLVTGVLAWSTGERPPLVETVRSIEEIKASKVVP